MCIVVDGKGGVVVKGERESLGGVTKVQSRLKRFGRAEERVEGSLDFDLLGCAFVVVNDAGSLIDAGLLLLEVPPSVHNDAVDVCP